jgi:hypothetical protein
VRSGSDERRARAKPMGEGGLRKEKNAQGEKTSRKLEAWAEIGWGTNPIDGALKKGLAGRGTRPDEPTVCESSDVTTFFARWWGRRMGLLKSFTVLNKAANMAIWTYITGPYQKQIKDWRLKTTRQGHKLIGKAERRLANDEGARQAERTRKVAWIPVLPFNSFSFQFFNEIKKSSV